MNFKRVRQSTLVEIPVCVCPDDAVTIVLDALDGAKGQPLCDDVAAGPFTYRRQPVPFLQLIVDDRAFCKHLKKPRQIAGVCSLEELRDIGGKDDRIHALMVGADAPERS